MHSFSTPITTHMYRHPPSSTDYHPCLTFPNLSLILRTSTFSQNKCHWFPQSGTLTPCPLPAPPPPHTTATHTTPNPEHQTHFIHIREGCNKTTVHFDRLHCAWFSLQSSFLLSLAFLSKCCTTSLDTIKTM